MDNDQTTLFEIKLNETGISFLKKLKAIALVSLILITVFSLINLIAAIRRMVHEPSLSQSLRGGFAEIKFRISSYSYFVIVAGNIVVAFLYFNFLQRINEAIRNNDEYLFNRSFKYLYQSAVTGLILVALNVMLILMFLPALLKI